MHDEQPLVPFDYHLLPRLHVYPPVYAHVAAPRRFFRRGIIRARDRGSHEGAERYGLAGLCGHDTYVACVHYVAGITREPEIGRSYHTRRDSR